MLQADPTMANVRAGSAVTGYAAQVKRVEAQRADGFTSLALSRNTATEA